MIENKITQEISKSNYFLPFNIVTQLHPPIFSWSQTKQKLLIEIVLPIIVGLGMGGLLMFIRTLSDQWSVLLLAAVAGIVIVLLVNDIKKLLLILIAIDAPLGLDIAPFTVEGHTGGPGGLEISLMTFVIVIGYALWFLDRSKPKRAPVRYFPLITVPALLFLFTNLLSFFQADFLNFSLFELALTTQLFLTYFYLVNHIKTEQDLKLFMTTLVIALFLEGLLMTAQFYTGFELDIAAIRSETIPVSTGSEEGGIRVGGTLGVSAASTWLAGMLSMTIGLLISKRKMVNPYLAVVALGVGVIALIATSARGGWMGLALAILIIIGGIISSARLRQVIDSRMMIIAAIGGIVILSLFSDKIITRLTGDDDGSAESRKPLAALAFNIRDDYPYGLGLNNYSEVMRNSRYVPPSLVGSSSIYVVHNKYLLVLTETGPWGLVAFVSLLAAGLFTTVQLFFRRNASPHLTLLSLSLFGALLGNAQQMLNDAFGTRQRLESVWVLIALLVVVHHLATSSSAIEAQTEIAPSPTGKTSNDA